MTMFEVVVTIAVAVLVAAIIGIRTILDDDDERNER
jgi:hypothetical protein